MRQSSLICSTTPNAPQVGAISAVIGSLAFRRAQADAKQPTCKDSEFKPGQEPFAFILLSRAAVDINMGEVQYRKAQR